MSKLSTSKHLFAHLTTIWIFMTPLPIDSGREYIFGILKSLNQVALEAGAREYSQDAVPREAVRKVTEESDFFFGEPNPYPYHEETDGAEVVKSSSKTWREWYHRQWSQAIYPPDVTTDEKLSIFYARRRPPAYKANAWDFIGFAVCAVISGEFNGWNHALQDGGYGGLWVSTIVAAILYFCLASLLAEMNAAIPSVGGMFSFARTVMGDNMAFLVGNSESLAYTMFSSLLMLTVSDMICNHFSQLPAKHFGPIIWAIYGLYQILIVCSSAKWVYKIQIGLTVYAGILLVTVFIINASSVDFKYASTNLEFMTDEGEGETAESLYFPNGVPGIFRGFMWCAWWFTGLEAVSVLGVEARQKKEDVRTGMYGSWLFLLFAAVGCCIFKVVVPPGAGIIAKAAYPIVDVMTTKYGNQVKSVILGLILPVYLANGIGMLMAAQRQLWGMARAGLVFPSLAVTNTNKDRMPWRAAIYLTAYSFVMCLLVEYADSSANADEAVRICLQLTIFSFMITYIGISIVYIAFRMRYPDIPRPFKSPVGIVGGILVLVISTITVISQLASESSSMIALIIFFIKMSGAGLLYTFQARMHLIPTEDTLITPFLTEYQRMMNPVRKKRGQLRKKTLGKKKLSNEESDSEGYITS